MDQSSSQLGTFIDTKEGGTTTTPELPSKESNSSCTTRLDDPHRRKPSSRPKRKCRFGPRSRHHHRVKSREAIPNSPPFCTVNGDDSHREKKVYLPNPSHTLVNSPPQVFQRLPDRVTLQPGSFPRRTPFDQYKKQSGDLRTEVNSTKHATFRLGISKKAFTEELEKELNDLLTEIETTRRGEQDYTELKCPEGKGSNVCLPCLPGDFSQQRQGKQNKGRKAPAPSKTPLPPKGQQSKGLLGSRPKRGRVRERTSPTCRDPPPPPPPRRSPVPIGTDEKVSNLPDERRYDGFPAEDRIRSDSRAKGERYGLDPNSEDIVILPDRPSIAHFSPALRSPFSRYLDSSPPPPGRPPPFRSVPERLGISDAAFEALLAAEIDEVLLPAAEERRRMRSPECEASPVSPSSPPWRVLSKDDCLTLCRGNDYPTTGVLLGVYEWAANLGIPHYNFEHDIDWNDLSFLDAYD